MRLSRLELSGFKSFADPVTLPYQDGITAIVGPNGCGKSNISDAVRWVLGEQRVRLLRGSRMDEVIFQGSVKRRPVNIAEVSLVFENDDGMLPVTYNEVVITRRLSRSGQSEYLLNREPVRLRDVQDLLRGTGLGSDAGVVIEAQMIDRLLSDRAEERRSLFEEAAGIGLYRDRKAATERRLERTAEDLQRLEDVINEVQTQVRSLARQRGKAERYVKLTDERFALVMTLTRLELAEIDAERAGLSARADALRQRIPEQRQQLADRSRAREGRVQERGAAETRRTELERRLAETRIALSALEGDLARAAERLQEAAERRTRALAEREQTKDRAARAAQALEAALDERRAAETARRAVQTELDLRTASEQEVKDRLARQRESVRQLEVALQERAEALRALQGERAALERDLEELHTLESQAAAHRSETEREHEAAAAEHARATDLVATRERDAVGAERDLESARDTLAAARERERQLREERRRLHDLVAQQTARRQALEDLERNREGLAPAARALLEHAGRLGDGTVLGPLSDYLRATAAEARAAEYFLADWLHAVLVRDQAAVESIREWHAAHRPGPLLLLPVHPGPEAGPSDPLPAGLEVTAPARAWVAALLAGHATVAGEAPAVRRPNGSVYLPAAEVSGPLRRKAELEDLTRALEEGSRKLAELERAIEAAVTAHAEAEQSLAVATEQHGRARGGLREAQGALDEASRRILRAERERSEAAAALGRVRERLADRQTRLRRAGDDAATGEAERARLEDALQAERTSLAELESAQESARERRVHWQVEEAQVSAREEAALERERHARAELDGASTEQSALERELAELERTSGVLEERRAQWADAAAERRAAVLELEQAVATAEAAVRGADAALAEDEEALERGRAQLEALSEELHGVELELTALDGKRRGLVERVEAEWHEPIEVLLADAPSVEGDPDALRAEAERLAQAIADLGPVNPLAVQEHAEETKRLEFLTSQRDDLVAARQSLEQALREIDETARAMFVETFAAIRANFQRVFHTLFEGGECDVRLTDESDPLASEIEIHAAPRGKRTQRIHLLSSGERALVAISLLFSIYLTKPSPFCVLDEVDAPLDDANVMRFVRLLEEFKQDTQLIVITHNPRTMQVADAVYGVTMQEPGISTIVGVRLGEVQSSVA
jgi:chromosome segregation protein